MALNKDLYVNSDQQKQVRELTVVQIMNSLLPTSDLLKKVGKTTRLFKVKVRVKVKLLSNVRLFATPWTVAHQAPPPMGFSRQEYWSGLPFPSPGDLPDPGIKPRSPALRAYALTSEPPGKSH